MLRKLLSLLFLIAAVFFPTSSASALNPGDMVMSLTPSEQDIDLIAGQTYTGSVQVSNTGILPFKVTARPSPFYVQNGTYDPDFVSTSSYTQMADWLKLTKTEFYINPGQSVTVPFEITVPADAVGGGQYAAIMLLADSGEESDDAMTISSQLAAILRGHIDGAETKLSGELLDHSLPQFMFNQSLSISETVKNTGNTDFKVTQTLTVRNFFTGHEIVSPNSVSADGHPIGTNVTTILPDTSRSSILTWTGAPQLGIFRVEQTIEFLDQSYFYQQVVFLCPFWLLFLATVIILVVIFSIIAKFFRKKHKDSADKLVS